MKKLPKKRLFRIVEEQYKTTVEKGVQTIYYIQELKTFMGFGKWDTITEWVPSGVGDVSLSRIEFENKNDAIAYVKWLRTPLPKDKYTYM